MDREGEGKQGTNGIEAPDGRVWIEVLTAVVRCRFYNVRSRLQACSASGMDHDDLNFLTKSISNAYKTHVHYLQYFGKRWHAVILQTIAIILHVSLWTVLTCLW